MPLWLNLAHKLNGGEQWKWFSFSAAATKVNNYYQNAVLYYEKCDKSGVSLSLSLSVNLFEYM